MATQIPHLSNHQAALLEGYARRMREHPTRSEAALWRELRGGRFGVRFVRQAIIGRFIVDFLAPRQKLVVEVDGRYHDETLRHWGYRVLRLDAAGCIRRLDNVLRRVVASIVP